MKIYLGNLSDSQDQSIISSFLELSSGDQRTLSRWQKQHVDRHGLHEGSRGFGTELHYRRRSPIHVVRRDHTVRAGASGCLGGRAGHSREGHSARSQWSVRRLESRARSSVGPTALTFEKCRGAAVYLLGGGQAIQSAAAVPQI